MCLIGKEPSSVLVSFVSLSSRYGLAARTAVPFTPLEIKQSWEHQDRANLRLNSGGRGAWEVTCSNLYAKQIQERDGVCSFFGGGSPTTCRQSKIMLTWKKNHKLRKGTYQKYLDLHTGCVQHREKLLGYAQEEGNQMQTRLVGRSGKISQPGNLLWGNS